MNSRVLIVLGTVVVLVILFFLGANLYKKGETERVEELSAEIDEVFVRDHSPVLGPDTARVTLIEFLDPECEACRVFYPLVKDLLNEFSGDLRLVIRYAPFHGNSKKAIRILEAARKQGKYWETLEVFFEKQPEWGDHHNPQPALLWTYLPELGLDVERIRKDVNDEAIERIIQQDLEDGQLLAVRRTPGFFVNGKPLVEFGFEELRELIQSEISAAKR